MKKGIALGMGVWAGVFMFFGGMPRSQAAPAGFMNQLLASGLNQPTDFAFPSNGGVLITEKTGQVMIFENGQVNPTPAIDLSAMAASISTGGDRGLLSIALDPNFSANHFVYLLYTTLSNHERISRFTINGLTIDPASEKVLLENPEAWSGFLNAGALRFGPDGKLYATMGSNGEGAIAQDLSSLDGKFLRINSDGTIPADNPFVATPGAQPAIYSTGFRNPWRFNFGPDGKAVIADVGENTWEKVVRAQSGANYGWPNFEGDCTPNCGGVTPPLFVVPHNGQGMAIVGGDFISGAGFPANYQGNYFFGDFVQGYLKNVVLNANGTVAQIQSFDIGDGSIAAINMGPDGCLYYADIFPGEFHKICAAGTSNTVSAVATANVTSGNLPLAVNFSAAQSTDGTGGSLSYAWNFGDGSTGTGATVSHTYTAKGIYTATVTAQSTSGASGSASVKIWAGYLPPNPVITAPVNGAKFNDGDVITYAGSATDPQDGTLSASKLTWTIIFHEDTHIDPPTVVSGASGGSYPIPTTTDEPTATIWYEFDLTATDSAGLTSTASVLIYPNMATLNFASNPTGAALLLDNTSIAAPYSQASVVGLVHSLSAPSPQLIGGNQYAFSSWSDGGLQAHTIATPASGATFTANFSPSSSSSGALAFTLAAAPGTPSYQPSSAASITTTVTANQNIGNLLLDTELWSGSKLMQNVVSPVTLAANTPQNFNWNLTAPAATGNYAVKVGLFASDWSKLFSWNDNATAFVVATGTQPLAFTDSVAADKSSYNASDPVHITSNIKANQNLPNVLLDTEMYDAGGTKVQQNIVPVNLAANTNFSSVWATTAPAATGAYTLKLGLFASDWSKLYFWDNAAAAFSVSNPAPLAFVVTAAMPTSTFPAGASTTVTTRVTATQSVPNVAVDTEIYDSNSVKVAQNVVDTNLAANQQFSSDWNVNLPAANGIYTVKVGIFSADFSKFYFWSNRAFQFTIGAPLPGPTPGQTYPVTVIAPPNGSAVSGTVEIKSVINGLDINSYNIGWRTGNGSFFNLDTEPVNQSYKHAWIDFSTWTWMPSGVYPMEFRATDPSNNVIGDTTISVTVQH